MPLFVVISTGLLLQLKKQVPWVQPPTQKGSAKVPALGFDQILRTASLSPEANITSWADIDRLDVRPGQGVVKVQATNGWEVQVDAATGAILQTAYRRSDFIEAMHDGSFFHEHAKMWIFLPTGLLLLCLWLTGLYLWIAPRLNRWMRRRTAPSPS